ncbi:hypothetical protein A1D29_08730 [Pasteurellaceae bacterium Orientalotternb1]|nr:hypothetical protein A1D29_08730 [Pasteurellaceae bacterium Orientalotternb1]
MTEKQWATMVAIVTTLMTTVLAVASNYSVWPDEMAVAERLRYTLENSLMVLSPFILSWLPYVFVRSAAVLGGVVASFGLMMTLWLVDDTGGWLLFIYLFWAIGAFFVALYPAFAKPPFFVKTAKRAFMLSVVFTLVGGFVVGLLVSRLF